MLSSPPSLLRISAASVASSERSSREFVVVVVIVKGNFRHFAWPPLLL